MNAFADHFKDWARKPFSADMPLWPDYFLLIGATLIIIVVWNIILRHVFDALQEG